MTDLSLRDYFASKAMLGELNAQSEEQGYYPDYSKLAKTSYEIADAMLAESRKPIKSKLKEQT